VPAKKATKKAPSKKKSAAKTASKKSAPKKKASVKKSAPKKKAPKKPASKKKPAPKKSALKRTVSKKSATKKTPSRKTVTKKASSKKTASRKQSPQSVVASSPELNDVSCQLALLALAQEDSPLGVRQREQLRRALATAGDALGWTAAMSSNGSSVADLRADVMAMAESGAKSLGRDLAEQLVNKKVEVAQLNKVIVEVRASAADESTVYPLDITFSHTVRDAYQELITKTETRVANDSDEAMAAAASIERSLPSWTKLADQMIIDLKKRQRQLETVTRSLPDFVQSSQDLLGEVVANLA
jgi:hypothetical protein